MTPLFTIVHYKVISKLGEGGMGVVWRATDSKLLRDVAIKVLPDSFAADPGRLARFTREAQVLASLNHPNIAAIYGVENRALIMELVEGPTLAGRIARGPISLDEALAMGKQIAEALEYAHERGVVHRDLKPANIKLTPEGRVKVLDFGLAKALENGSTAGDTASSPTQTMGATLAGAIMGTAAYMSPEQARGQNVDRRADIWAFGVVLYEMLTGRRLFGGPTVSDTLAAVLKGEVDLASIPVRVRPVLERCLRRDLRQRWHCMGDVFVMLEEGVPAAPLPQPTRSRLQPAALVVAIIAVIALAGWWHAMRPLEHPLTRLSVDLGPGAMTGLNATVLISPDGRRLVFPARGPTGKQQLATRLLDQAQATLLSDTDNGFDPFFSPDGQWIGFFAGGQLKKISVQGGAPVVLCAAAATPRGASWGEDGNIVAALSQVGPLSRVPATGGTAQRLTKLDAGETTNRWPQILLGGEVVLFTAAPTNVGLEDANIKVVSLKTGQVKVLQHGGYYGRYLPSGHLVYVHQGVLFGVGFDADRLEVRGTPRQLLSDLAANPTTGGGQFDSSGAASGPGTLVYMAGKGAAQTWQVGWLDSSGKVQSAITTPGIYNDPRLSPDGRNLLFNNGTGIYIHDLERDTGTRLTLDLGARSPVWTPDGKHIAFASVSGGHHLSWMRSDGVGEPQRLLESQNVAVAFSFSPTGRRLAYFDVSPETGYDLWTLPLDLADPDHPKPGKPEPFLRTPADELAPQFSPDGRWIAYRSNETGNYEVYVRPFPAGSGGKWQVSTGEGVLFAFWSNNDRELFYETADNRIMVLNYTVNGDSFVHGKPRLWSNRQMFFPGGRNLDLAPDGKRFAVLSMPEATDAEKGSVHVTILQNFFDEVRRRIPAGDK